MLVAEHLRLGTWDLIKAYTQGNDADLNPRIAMQIVNEAALCSNRIRRSNYISHQGFEILNGLGFLVSDSQAHQMFDQCTIAQSRELQQTLALIRKNSGHFPGSNIAIDPHRIPSTTKRIMPQKKKQPDKPSQKMLQTFFAIDTISGQPYGFEIGSSATNTSLATMQLLNTLDQTKPDALILADKEHFTESLFRNIDQKFDFDFLVPVITSERIKKIERSLKYDRQWAGYAIAETSYNFYNTKKKYRLISQREGETERDFVYKSFLTLSDKDVISLLTEDYADRWSIEEFFNFEGAIGFDRASTFNLNIRYSKMSLALLAQAAMYEFRKKLPQPYKRWNATHLAEAIFSKIDGDIRVMDDKIIVTYYDMPDNLHLQQHYEGLPEKLINQNINPKVPWLFNFMVDFRFK